MISPIVDRLRVFVSSTIKECADERDVARKAIKSLGHEPVLFEDVGARPYPPRELYLARLEFSQIFVGIYKESYGWVAPDMDISGIEDEFRVASDRKMDRLIYVYASPANRDPRLESLIDLSKNSGLTIAPYTEASQLKAKLRRDLTAVISSRFVEQAVALEDEPRPEEVLNALLPNPSHRFRRRDIEAKLVEKLTKSRRIVVTAPLGSGKTIMLAQLSVDNGWIFVDGQGLNRLDLLARVANGLRHRLGQAPVTFATERHAASEIARASDAQPDSVVAVDGAEEAQTLWQLPVGKYSLVLTSRIPLEIPSEQRFDIPVLARNEIIDWVKALRGSAPEPNELSALVARSEGSPLYLRFYAMGGDTSADLSLRDLEIRALQSLSPTGKEITSYLALAGKPMSLDDLRLLIDPDQSPEIAAQEIVAAGGLVKQTRRHAQFVHEHLKSTVLDQLQAAPARLNFFANRLGQFAERAGRYVSAFHAYVAADEWGQADRILDQAAYQAALMGGGFPSIAIYKRKARIAHDLGKHGEEVNALLSVAYACNQTGARDEAIRALEDAATRAKEHNDETGMLRVREITILLGIHEISRDQRIQELDAIRTAQTASGNTFDAARIGTLLAVEYIAKRDFAAAEAISRESSEFFTKFGDEYGIRVSQVNLAAALSGMNGREGEAAQILQQLQCDLDPEENPRERAALCNFLTRHYRRLKETTRAAEFAMEALRIGEELKDLHLIAINRVNLGNLRRDEAAFDKALEEYRAAEQAGITGCIIEDEATANELMASVLNEQEKFALALQHAQHAVNLARRAGDPVLIARAEEERGIAFEGQREIINAADAYTSAAKAIATFRPEASYFVSLVIDALRLCAKSGKIECRTKVLNSVFLAHIEPIGDDHVRTLYAALVAIARTIRVDRLLPVVALATGSTLTDAPTTVERRIILQAAHELLKEDEHLESDAVLMTMAAILMAHSGECLTLSDLVTLSEQLSRFSPGVYFKPQSDGAAHWTVRLNIADGIIVTIAQLDDSPKTAVTTMIITLLLKSLEGMIRRSLLEGDRMPREEAIINVVNRTELEAQIEPALMDLGQMRHGFSIAESTDLSRSDQPPIVVICADDFGKPWRPEEQRFCDTMMLLTELLRVLTGHLLAKAIEPDVLFPKISGLIRKIAFQGVSGDDAN